MLVRPEQLGQKPVEQVLPEIPPVKLIAEFVEIFLKEFLLDVMVHVLEVYITLVSIRCQPCFSPFLEFSPTRFLIRVKLV